MSAAQPGPAAPTAVTIPRFPITLWGYERRYVDSFVTGLVKQLEGERQQSDQAKRALRQLQQDVEHGRAQVPAWFSSVGTEIDQVLDNAGRAAAKLLAEAGRRIQAATDAAEIQAADRLREAEEQVRKLEETARLALADAQTERARIEEAAARAAEEQLARADHETKALMDRAHEEARRVQEHAASERRQLEAERQRLGTLRQSMVEQLVQVYAPLGLTLVDARGQLQAPAQGDHRQPLQAPPPAAVAEPGAVPQPGTTTESGTTTEPGATTESGAGREPDGTTEHDAAIDPDAATDPGAGPDRGADPEPGPAAQPGVVDGNAVRRLDAWAKQDDGAP
jgi:cell division septum initiation protein DivIVA